MSRNEGMGSSRRRGDEAEVVDLLRQHRAPRWPADILPEGHLAHSGLCRAVAGHDRDRERAPDLQQIKHLLEDRRVHPVDREAHVDDVEAARRQQALPGRVAEAEVRPQHVRPEDGRVGRPRRRARERRVTHVLRGLAGPRDVEARDAARRVVAHQGEGLQEPTRAAADVQRPHAARALQLLLEQRQRQQVHAHRRLRTVVASLHDGSHKAEAVDGLGNARDPLHVLAVEVLPELAGERAVDIEPREGGSQAEVAATVLPILRLEPRGEGRVAVGCGRP
mmetsp:Transcript_72274/g.209243  ORF Transcript_72274/g.209243 Transcript_72274/m.209243 type:complete len:279 (+) Transcript_72274:165-1001(+)